jgi:hypothetical protein
MSPRDPYDPTWPTVADVYFDDDSSCRLDGTVPFKFGLEIPGLFGSYRCTNRAGDQVDSGSFGVRTTSVGRPFRRFD